MANYGKNPNKANNTSQNGYNKAAAPMQFDGAVINRGRVNPRGLSTWKLEDNMTKLAASVKTMVSSASPQANPARMGNGEVGKNGWDG